MAAASLGDFPLSVAAGMYLGRASRGLGQYRRAADVLQEVVASLVGERARDYLGLPVLPAVFARSQLVLALADLGDFDEAERFIKEAIEIAESTRHPDTLLWAYTGAGFARLVRGHVASATSALKHAFELCQTADMPAYAPLVSSPLGLAYAMGGRVPEGLTMVEQAVEQTESKRQVALLPWTLLRLGEARLLADKAGSAGEAASRALALFREHKERGGEAYALGLQAEIAARNDEVQRAEALFNEVDALVESLGMRPLAARCRLDLGLLLAARGRHADSRSDLFASAEAFRHMGMEYWSIAVQKALAGFDSRK